MSTSLTSRRVSVRPRSVRRKSFPRQNRILAGMPAEVQARVFPDLELIDLPLAQVLYGPDEVAEQVYFPTNCIVSNLTLMTDGTAAEVSAVGNEGMVGISLFLGGGGALSQTIVRSSGAAYRFSGERFKLEIARHDDFLALMLRYTQCRIAEMTQNAGCFRHHSIEQQFCRWLLLSLDRMRDKTLRVTQQLIADMLGVRREGISAAAAKLRKSGLISSCQGEITVLDRTRLEAQCCECYGVVRAKTDLLLPWRGDAGLGS